MKGVIYIFNIISTKVFTQQFMEYYILCFIIIIKIIVKNMLAYPLSTRSKNHSEKSEKRFFKKVSTDQNARNFINLNHQVLSLKPQSSISHQKISTPSKNIISLTNHKSQIKNSSKTKKSQLNLFKYTKSNKTSMVMSSSQHLQSLFKENIKIFRKQNSVKNLKLTSSSSTEFPPLLTKSLSQTTVNKKMDENKLRLLQKIGMKKKDSQKTSNRLNISMFRLGKKLGSGRFGNVYLGEQKNTKFIYAIKVMNKAKIKQADMQDQVFWQIKLQSFMVHPNILKLYGHFDDQKNIYLILEYCSQCLFKQFRNKVKLSEQETSYYGKQLMSALKYLHNESIIHRDIKPENIMLQHGVIKLADFGWSIYSPIYKRQTFCGTVDYVPPQIVQGRQYDQRVDIWAFGVLLYELASGHAPFETKQENLTYQKIVQCICKFPKHFSQDLKYLVSKILQKRPEDRPELQSIQTQRWFEKYKGIGRYISKQIWSAWQKIQ